MPTTTITSKEFRRSTFRDLSVAAKQSPVSITTNGMPAYVLLSYKEYRRLTGSKTPASDVATR
jgi:prevent-host-death family protein